MTITDVVERGRDAFRRRDWGRAYAELSAARGGAPLDPPGEGPPTERTHLELEDLERLATAAHLAGRYDEAADVWAHAHHEMLRDGNPAGAARCAFWLGFTLVNRGEHARGSGWFARAGRVLDDSGVDAPEAGYLLIPQAIQAAGEGAVERALSLFDRALGVGERFSDPELVVLARHGRGRILIRMGETALGTSLLDEVMVSVTSDELSCLLAGVVYCSVLEACQECFDPGRAREWTAAMSRWLESQRNLVPYRGQCLVHRSEVMQLCGDWDEAMEEARKACDWLTRPPGEPAAGAAYYQQGELHRLRGETAEAEAAYREASRWGRSPEPGFALLRLAQGQLDQATAAIRRAVAESGHPAKRAPLLAAQVEILVSGGDIPGARSAAEELEEFGQSLDAVPLRAAGAAAKGAVLLEEGDARGALPLLRDAWERWTSLDAPWEAARVRVLLARACQAVGDDDGAGMELEGAREAFEELGATPDVGRVDALLAEPSPAGKRSSTHGLTPREMEVLRLLATGRTNRQIGAELFISERTVERHVSNIFSRLGVPSRSAATAYAYRHELV